MSSKKILTLIVFSLLIVGLSFCVATRVYKEERAPPSTSEVQLTLEGFMPSSISVNEGTLVTFINNSNADLMVNFNYPHFEKDVEIAKNRSYSFVYDVKGTWKYYAVDTPLNLQGEVIVE